MGRGRFFESRVTGGASGRNTSSLKSWRDGPLSEQRSISERCDSIFRKWWIHRIFCDTAEIEMVDTRTGCGRHDTHVRRVVVIVPCSDLRGYDMRAMSSHGIQSAYRPFRVPRVAYIYVNIIYARIFTCERIHKHATAFSTEKCIYTQARHGVVDTTTAERSRRGSVPCSAPSIYRAVPCTVNIPCRWRSVLKIQVDLTLVPL